MSLGFDFEFGDLLKKHEDPALVAEEMAQLYRANVELRTPENYSALTRFMVQAGLYTSALQFILENLADESLPIPWEWILEIIHHGQDSPLEDHIQEDLLQLIRQDGAEERACRTSAMDAAFPHFRDLRREIQMRAVRKMNEYKQSRLDMLATLRTQQLYEQEKEVLAELESRFPEDPDVLEEVKKHRERYALEILSQRKKASTSRGVAAPVDPEVEKAADVCAQAIVEAASKFPDMARDLAVAAAMIDRPQAGLDCLQAAADNEATAWLRAELLLLSGRYVELLAELAALELRFATDSETFFATSYLRAQAWWGLRQKAKAIEILETLLASRPDYRAADALLSLWRSQ
ncbi:MAG: hypothetical protein N2578_05980 [Bdellovibrionaceae bacterium]|nr:hypothetical protein [Pseudobdellovibrionaceae bacterium]